MIDFTRKNINKGFFLKFSEFSSLSHDILNHCFIVLNIIHHLIENTAPVIAPTRTQSQVSQNAITNPNASPIKAIKAATIVQDLTEAVQKDRKSEAEQSKQLGNFANSHHYMRLFDNMKSIYMVQRSNLDS